MSAIPVFEIGVWNAWIFMLINFLPTPIVMRVHRGLLEDSLRLYGEANKKVYYLEWVLWAHAFVWRNRIRMYSYSRCYKLPSEDKLPSEWVFHFSTKRGIIVDNSSFIMKAVGDIENLEWFLEAS